MVRNTNHISTNLFWEFRGFFVQNHHFNIFSWITNFDNSETIHEGDIQLVNALIQASTVSRTNAVTIAYESKVFMRADDLTPIRSNNKWVTLKDIMQASELTRICTVDFIQNEQMTFTHC